MKTARKTSRENNSKSKKQKTDPVFEGITFHVSIANNDRGRLIEIIKSNGGKVTSKLNEKVCFLYYLEF